MRGFTNARIVAGVGVLLAAFGILLLFNMQATMKSFPVSTKVGVWSWESPDTVSIEQASERAKLLKKEGISKAYIDITTYVDLMELSDDKNPQQAIGDFTSKLKATVRAYNNAGVECSALAGNSKWGSPDRQYLPLALIDYLKDYNAGAAPEEKLHGVQFDIEPYSQEGFYDDAQTSFKDYLTVTRAIIDRYANHFNSMEDMDLGFAVPFWFDGENPEVPKVALGNTTNYPVFHLIDQLKTIRKGYIAVMAYRNQTGGDDGSIKHAQAEVDYASQTETVKVYIGQETGNVEPAQITFYSLGKDKLRAAAGEIEKAFKNKTAYSGIIVHDSSSFRELSAK